MAASASTVTRMAWPEWAGPDEGIVVYDIASAISRVGGCLARREAGGPDLRVGTLVWLQDSQETTDLYTYDLDLNAGRRVTNDTLIECSR